MDIFGMQLKQCLVGNLYSMPYVALIGILQMKKLRLIKVR